MNKLRLSKTDPELEREGVEAEYQGVTLIVARRSSPDFLAAVSPVEGESKEERRDRMTRAVARHLLVGWRGWEGVDYSYENALNLMTNDFDAREFVIRVSGEADRYVRQEAEELGEG